MADPSDRGWGNPGRRHGDPQAVEYGRRHITTIETLDGSRFPVRKEVAPILLGFLNEIITRGYRIRGEVLDDWGWYVRTIGNTNTLSNHAWGLAVDVNALTNPQGHKLTTDMPRFVPEAAQRWRLRWGGTYALRPDGMHFEWIGSRDDALRFVADLKTLQAITYPGEDPMRYPADRPYETLTIEPDGLGDLAIPVPFGDLTSVLVKANDDGTLPIAVVLPQPALDQRQTVLRARGEPGTVGVIVGYRKG